MVARIRTATQRRTADGEAPLSRLLVDTGLLRAGRFAVAAEDPRFATAGQVLRHEFVFPRASVWIEHPGRDPFLADPSVVTYYNRGQPYRRRSAGGAADRCEWFALEWPAMLEVLRHFDPRVEERPASPFPFSHGPSDARSYAEQRLVTHHLASEATPDLLFIEETMLRVFARLLARAFALRGSRRPQPPPRDADELVLRVRSYVGDRLGEKLTLSRLAGAANCSPFQLCRAFKAVLGRSAHSWLTERRLLAALERVAERDSDLATIALDHGFAHHSHFSTAFRRAFSMSPSQFRRCAQRGNASLALAPH